MKSQWRIDPAALVANSAAVSLARENVRIRPTPETEAAGVAGRMGNVAGFTQLSVTGVQAIGEVKDDLAFSVTFENPRMQLSLAPDLLALRNALPEWKSGLE